VLHLGLEFSRLVLVLRRLELSILVLKFENIGLGLGLEGPYVLSLVRGLETILWLLYKLKVLHFIFKFMTKCNYACHVIC